MNDPHCNICKQSPPAVYVGKAKLCEACSDQIANVARDTASARGGTLLLAFKISVTGRNYRVPPGLVLMAELRAKEMRHRTGHNVTWTDVLRAILDPVLLPTGPAEVVADNGIEGLG